MHGLQRLELDRIVAILLLRNEPHWTAYPRRYYCDFKVSNITLGTYAIPMLCTQPSTCYDIILSYGIT
ncbi:hypothetical protein EDD11_001821 [Mortierella claussenii]|nr:hypothetical protein EDD11_001821 [Mortierella claussenii]